MDLLTIPNIVEYLKKNKNFFTYDNDVFVITFGYFNAYLQVEYSDTNTIEVLQFFIRNDDDSYGYDEIGLCNDCGLERKPNGNVL